VRTTEPGTFVRRTGRRQIASVTADRVLVTPLRPSRFLATLAERRAAPRAR
jgi:hypothetical protein